MAQESTISMDSSLFDSDELLFDYLDEIDFRIDDNSLFDKDIEEVNAVDSSTTTSEESGDNTSLESNERSKKKLCKYYGNGSSNNIVNTTNTIVLDYEVSISKPMIKRSLKMKCENYPRWLIEAFNTGDNELLRSATLTFVDPQCKFRLRKPGGSRIEIGPLAIICTYEAFQFMAPDVIFLLRGMKKKPIKNGYVLRCKVNVSGTIVDMNAFEKFQESFSYSIKPITMADQMDTKKISKANIDATRTAEVLIKEQNKFIHSFCKGAIYFHINTITQKIEYFDQIMSLSSIKAFEGDLDEIDNKIPGISIS